MSLGHWHGRQRDAGAGTSGDLCAVSATLAAGLGSGRGRHSGKGGSRLRLSSLELNSLIKILRKQVSSK